MVDLVMGHRGGKYGFISSHAANAAGLATFTALIFRNKLFTSMMIVFALLTGYSRIYLGLHFLSDVVVGTLVGILSGYAVYWVWKWKKWEQPIYSKRAGYFLCVAYVVIIGILFLFNNQLVNFIAKE
jgi:undecaprenyl-diphosphatase